MTVRRVATTAHADQAPGTSGLRRRVERFRDGHYLENFVQAIFNANTDRRLLVVGGDGRYFNREAAHLIVRMAAANGFSRVVVGRDALLSTPALSHLVRSRGADGGIVLSASHNPGGADGDFGIKFNNASGAPAPESVTRRIHHCASTLDHFLVHDDAGIDLHRTGMQRIGATGVEVIDPVDDYLAAMTACFDFDRLREGFARGRLSLCFDAMHAVTGPYARRIFEQVLGATPGSVIRGEPLEDFGGGHPDPNLVHARGLVERMARDDAPRLGAASDGDGDRNLVLGPGCFVGPGDSLALLAAHAGQLPQFAGRLRGVARSMPTSRAVDRVAAALGFACHQTPTGWKYFGNLLDAGHIQLCGEESFGTGGDHVREKDGLWAVLAWLSLLAETDRPLGSIVTDHWRRFGRNVYCRYDYEGVGADGAEALVEHLRGALASLPGQRLHGMAITAAREYGYHDPVDGETSTRQGIEIELAGDARIVYRLSGTGTSGATLRVYLEQVLGAGPGGDFGGDARAANAALGEAAATLAEIPRFTGRQAPSLRT